MLDARSWNASRERTTSQPPESWIARANARRRRELDEPRDPAAIERDAGRARRSPARGQRARSTNVVRSARAPTSSPDPPFDRRIHMRAIDEFVHIVTPASRVASDSQQFRIDRRVHATQRRKQIVPHTIPRIARRGVRRILDPLELVRARVRDESADATRRAAAEPFSLLRIESGETARAGGAHARAGSTVSTWSSAVCAVTTTGSSPTPRRHGAKESPARRAKIRLALERLRRALANALDPDVRAAATNEIGGARRRDAGSVIEGRDAQATRRPSRDGGIEQHHRVESAGHGEDNSRVPAQPVLHMTGESAWSRRRGLTSKSIAAPERRRSPGNHWNVVSGLAILPSFGSPLRSARPWKLTARWAPSGSVSVSACFYIALIWLNTLLGFFLTPLFIIPATWLMDQLGVKRDAVVAEPDATSRP